jgi:hypothetical protein
MQTPSPADAPAAHIEAMLLATGRFDGTTSALMARWTQAFYATMAARTGTTPQALYERLPLKVVAAQPQSQGAGVLHKISEARKSALPELVEQAIRNLKASPRMWSLLQNSVAQAGPSDGACLICARAIIQAAGRGELVRIVSVASDGSGSNRAQTEHYGALIDGVIHDFNGSYRTPQAWVRGFAEQEGLHGRQLDVAHGHDVLDKEIPDDPQASSQLAGLLAEQLATLVGSKDQTETAAFKAWFGDSQVVGPEGRPMVVYHATFKDFEVFAKSTDLGYHFGTAKAANDRIKHEGKKAKNRDRAARIIPAYLNIRRPAVLADQITWSAPSLAKALLQGGYITSEQAKPVLDGTVDQSGPDPAGAFHRHLVQALKANGYDGIQYRNLVEGTTRGLGDAPIENLIEVVPNEWFGKGSDAPFTARFKDTGYPVGGAKADTPEATMELARKLLARRKNALDYSYIAFSPGQVKSAIGNDGSFSRESENLLHQAAHPDLARKQTPPGEDRLAAPDTDTPPSATNPLGLISSLSQALRSAPAARAPAQAWRDMLRGLVRHGRIRQEELSWSGLDEWLDTVSKSGDGTRLSKSDMLQRLETTQVQVEEIVLGDPGATFKTMSREELVLAYERVVGEGSLDDTDEDDEDSSGQLSEERLRERLQDFALEAAAADGITEDGRPTARFAHVTLPGGTHYREVLLALKTDTVDAARNEALFFDILRPDGTLVEAGVHKNNVQDHLRLMPNELAVPSQSHDPEWAPKGSFRSEHWPTPNVIVHFRVDDRVDSMGRKVLFVTEIQSDWGQAGRRQGFDRPLQVKGWSARPGPGDLASGPVWEVRNEMGAWVLGVPRSVVPSPNAAIAHAARRGYPERGGGQEQVPRGPFVTTTQGWLDLALKRIIVMAAQGGYDRVALIGGEQAAWLQGLRHQVKFYNYSRNENGTFWFYAQGVNQERLFDEDPVTLERIAQVAGQAIADLVERGAGQRMKGSEANNGLRILWAGSPSIHSPIDPSIPTAMGGEGVMAFYDEIVPKALARLLPKVGGTRLGVVDLGRVDSRRYWVRDVIADGDTELEWVVTDGQVDQGSADVSWHVTEKEAQDEAARLNRSASQALSQPGFDITPAMRAQALQGLPLFQSALHPRASQTEPRGSLDPRTLEIALGPKADASTWIHETGHLFLEALAEMASDADAPAQIVEDFDTVLDWFGLTREEWSRFTLDEKRPHHERWAQAVELYVMEERPPCEQLRPLMEVFAGWLRAVYSATSETLKTFAKASPTSTKEFKAWFGGSKVVDENGEPLVVYRGQRRVAKPDKFVTMRGRKNPSFAADPAVASVYSRQLETRQYGAGSNVMPVYLSIKKPLDIRCLGEQVSLEGIVRRLNWDWSVSSGLGDHEKSLGYGDLADALRGMDRLAERTGARFNIEASDENGFTINSFEDLANYIQQRGDKGDFESIDLAIMDTTFDAYMIGDSVDWTYLLSELGFDGVFHKDAFDVGARYYEGDKSKLEEGCEGSPTHDTYRLFKQADTKSATGNDGSFDRDDRSILSQGPQAPCRLGLTDDIRRVMDRLLSVQACAQALPPEQDEQEVLPGKLDGQDEPADPGEPAEQEEQDDDAWRPRERMRA